MHSEHDCDDVNKLDCTVRLFPDFLFPMLLINVEEDSNDDLLPPRREDRDGGSLAKVDPWDCE